MEDSILSDYLLEAVKKHNFFIEPFNVTESVKDENGKDGQKVTVFTGQSMFDYLAAQRWLQLMGNGLIESTEAKAEKAFVEAAAYLASRGKVMTELTEKVKEALQ